MWFAITQAAGAVFNYLNPGVLNDRNMAAALGWALVTGLVVICFITVRKYYKAGKKLEQQMKQNHQFVPGPVYGVCNYCGQAYNFPVHFPPQQQQQPQQKPQSVF